MQEHQDTNVAPLGRSAAAAPRVETWVNIYKTHFPDELAGAGGPDALRGMVLPEPKNSEFSRLIVVLEGMTPTLALSACARHFDTWQYVGSLEKDAPAILGDLDKNIAWNDRVPDETYAVWVRNSQEPDEIYKNRSADDLESQGIKGITLIERMLLELVYYIETGNNLDLVYATLCTGSRNFDGQVLHCEWNNHKFRVNWCIRTDRRDGPCVREVSV